MICLVTWNVKKLSLSVTGSTKSEPKCKFKYCVTSISTELKEYNTSRFLFEHLTGTELIHFSMVNSHIDILYNNLHKVSASTKLFHFLSHHKDYWAFHAPVQSVFGFNVLSAYKNNELHDLVFIKSGNNFSAELVL